MINSFSVLLHLVRSRVVNAGRDEIYQTAFAVKTNDLKAQGGRSGSRAAFETLRCDNNRKLPLHYKGVSSQTGSTERKFEDECCLEDLVKSILDHLEKIVDTRNGLPI